MKSIFSVMLFLCVLVSIGACQKKAEFKKYETEADVPRIAVADAKKDFDAGNAIIIDSRPETSYKAEHITGSINIPYGEQDAMMDKIPKGKKIIVYCSWPSEHTSAGLAFALNQKNIPDTHALLGGTQAWKSAGYPMEKSQ